LSVPTKDFYARGRKKKPQKNPGHTFYLENMQENASNKEKSPEMPTKM
jgi:hypothetical protein